MTTFTVTSNADTDTSGTLRFAIEEANANRGSTIAFAGGLAGSTIALTADLPMLDANVTIDGGTDGITIDGAGQHRVFFANSGNIVIENLTLANGFAQGGSGGEGFVGNSGGGGMGAGGAIFVRGSLGGHAAASVTLVNIGFTNNVAQGGNGGADPGLTQAASQPVEVAGSEVAVGRTP